MGEGAFLHAPVVFGWGSDYTETGYYKNGYGSEMIPNYEYANVSVSRIHYNEQVEANLPFMQIVTLDEPEYASGRYKFTTSLCCPGLFTAVENLETEYLDGKSEWMERNMHRKQTVLEENLTVLMEATPEKVQETVDRIKTFRSKILDFKDIKSYNSYLRASKKQNKGV